MKLALLLSGGKDSLYAGFLAKKHKHKLTCLITIQSANKASYMFHTPSIQQTERQAEAMAVPIIIKQTAGKKEVELQDLENAIKQAKIKYHIDGIVTGAVKSVYQASRIQEICNKLNIECFSPLWQADELSYLTDLIKNKFKVIITGVFAYPLNQSWLGKQTNKQFINEIKLLHNKYQLSMAGEGGEYETFVLDCPLFKKGLKIKSFKDIKEGENSWRRELEIK
jgi:ABC transporter with metal-binding/Fe-S-binding domain ATP-binding protein